MITDREIQAYWNKWDLIILSWNCVSGFYILSAVSFLLLPFTIFFDWHWLLLVYPAVIPVNFLLKYGFGIRGLWFFNDSPDGDFGNKKLLKKYGYENKPMWFKFIWWWWRNHSWGYITMFKPSSNGTNISESRVLINSREKFNPVWLKENGVFHLCYRDRETGTVECRYSKVTDKFEKHFGAAGLRYKLHYKLRFKFKLNKRIMDLKNNREVWLLYGVAILAVYGTVRLVMDLINWLWN